MDIPQLLATWLHTLAFVIAWGYYGVLGRMLLPALEQSLDQPAQAVALVGVERRARPLLVLSVALFTATGTYLLFVDPDYEGLGNFFASTWTTLMLIKHVLVIALIALAVLVDRLIRRVGEATSDSARGSALRRLRLSAEGATGLGALIALLTVAAQLAALRHLAERPRPDHLSSRWEWLAADVGSPIHLLAPVAVQRRSHRSPSGAAAETAATTWRWSLLGCRPPGCRSLGWWQGLQGGPWSSVGSGFGPCHAPCQCSNSPIQALRTRRRPRRNRG